MLNAICENDIQCDGIFYKTKLIHKSSFLLLLLWKNTEHTVLVCESRRKIIYYHRDFFISQKVQKKRYYLCLNQSGFSEKEAPPQGQGLFFSTHGKADNSTFKDRQQHKRHEKS